MISGEWIPKPTFMRKTGVIFILVAALTFLASFSLSADDTIALAQGLGITRSIKAGVLHRYSIRVAAGEFFILQIGETDLQYEISIFAPTSSRRVVRNQQYMGTMSVSVVADLSGEYLAEITSKTDDVAVGKYEIVLREKRLLQPEDHSRIKAENLVQEAFTLDRQQDGLSRRQAIAKFQEALELWRSLGHKREEATTLITTGRTHYYLGNNRDALKCFNNARLLWLELRDSAGLAESLFNIGKIHFESGEPQPALECWETASKLWGERGDLRGQARTYITLGVLNNQLGNYNTAIRVLNQAKELNDRLNDVPGKAAVRLALGDAYFKTGNYRSAEDQYLESLSLAEQSRRKINQNLAQGALGEVLLQQGRMKEALVHFTGESEIAEQLLDTRLKAFAARHLGMAYDALRDKEKALKFFQASLAFDRQEGNIQEEAANLNSIGNWHETGGELNEALTLYRDALQLSRASADRSEEISILSNIARVQRNLGNLGDARANAESAIRLIESIRQQAGGRQLRTSYFATVQQSYSIYVDLLMRQHKLQPGAGLDALALQASESYRSRSLLDSLAEARAEIRKGVSADLLKRERELQRLLNFKAERQTAMLSGYGKKEETEVIARELRALEIEYEQLQERIRQAAPGYAALTQPRTVTSQEIQKQLLDDQTLLLIYSLGDERSYLWVVAQDSLNSYELPSRAVIETKASDAYKLMTARERLDRKNFEQFQRQVRQADAQYWQQAEALSQIILGPVAAQLGNKRLLIVSEGALQYLPFGALPEPGAKKRPSRRPATSPPGNPSTYQPLLINHEIVYLPSVSVLAAIRQGLAGQNSLSDSRRTLAVLADPVFTRNDSRLPAVGRGSVVPPSPANSEASLNLGSEDLDRALQELRAANATWKLDRLKGAADEALDISSFVESDSRLMATGTAANVELVKGAELGQYRFVHFATHGLLNDEHPELSGLVFSLFDAKGIGQEGFLRMHEIYNLKLAAEMVVLSSCEGGIGKEIRGEGLMALTRGFFYAGASRVAASLWKADDAATPILMRGFYKNLLKEKRRPADALRMAQIAMWDRLQWQAPYYWAGFVLQGEYR